MALLIRSALCVALVAGFADGFFLQNLINPSAPKSPAASSRMPELLELVDKSIFGTKTEYDDDIKSLMVEISESRKGDQRKKLPGNWELLYTTEKETNFFRTSWPFAKVESITQTLDPSGTNELNNSINFIGGGAFIVEGVCSEAETDETEYDRVEFQFKSAAAKVWGRTVTLPPVGAGYFDTMYCDDTYRLSQDSRGDWSVFTRMN